MIKIMTNIKQLIMTLVALFAMTTGAWAQETVFEYADPMVGSLTQGTTGTSATTVKIHNNSTTVNAIKFSNSYVYDDGKYITIAPESGSFKKGDKVTIAGCINTATAEVYAKAGIYTADGATQLYETANVINGRDTNDDPEVETYTLTQDAEKLLIARSTGTTALYITTLKVVRTASAAGTPLTSTDGKVWTLAAMPAGNVELQVAYYPGMLVKPTNLVGGTMEIEGVSDTALPDGFEKDDAGNIYVEAGKKFTVKAVPATGYQLVGWSDDATIKDLEREFTMPTDGSDFTLTATFSDEFELAFEALTANTIEDGKATVKVNGTDATLTDGKLTGVKAGQTVTLTAKQGYKFRGVEAKKGISTLKSVKIDIYTVYYAEGENWYQAFSRDENRYCGLETSVGCIFNFADKPLLDSGGNNVSADAPIDPSKGYHFAN